MEGIQGWVLNIAAVSVLIIILDLLTPEGRIRKFTRLLAGFVLMFIMINPVLQMFGKGVPDIFAGWEEETFLWNSQVRTISGNISEEQRKQTLQLYRQMLLSDIQKRLESHELLEKAEVDVVLNENVQSEKFGEIRKLYINLLFREGDGKKEDLRTEAVREIQKELQRVFFLSDNEIIIHSYNQN